ncbi:hypothetical protein LCGC14_2849560, partial [marine sediment metagenome]
PFVGAVPRLLGVDPEEQARIDPGTRGALLRGAGTLAGVGAEIVATIAERMPHVRVKRLGARRETIPAALSMHNRMLPTDEEILNAITSLNQTQ